MIDFLLAAMNPSAHAPLFWPTFGNLQELATSAPLTLFAFKPGYEESLNQVLEGINGASGDLFAAFRGLDLEEDIVARRKNLVIDICKFHGIEDIDLTPDGRWAVWGDTKGVG